MAIDLNFPRRWRDLALAAGMAVVATAAAAQDPAPAGVSYAAPAEEGSEARADNQDAAPEARASRRSRPGRVRSRIEPYLEVAQVVSADLDSGDQLTYTSLAVGVDGRVETRRVTIQASYRYQRNIEWNSDVAEQELHSGIAMVNAEIVPNALQIEAGGLATRTAGEGRALGATERGDSVEVYSVYAGPTLSTHAGPVAVNASYRLGYVKIDDDLDGGERADFDFAVAHSATASVGMSPGRLPIGWTVGAGYTRTESDGEFEDEFEGVFVRGDVVLPVSPTFAVTAGVGYEDIQATQNDLARDAGGGLILGPDGAPIADPNRPRVLAYDLDGIIYDAGVIWRPSARTELQARAGHRYGGTTFVGTLSHQIDSNTGINAAVFDTVETFSNSLINDLSGLPDNFEVNNDPVTGGLGGCVFGADPGSGVCLTRALQSIRGSTFRLRGASLIVSGGRGLWDWGIGAGYAHRRYGQGQDPDFDLLGPREDDSIILYGSLNRRLSRTSEIGVDAYASWYDTDEANFGSVFSAGATTTYSRDFMLERLRMIASLGLYHSDDGTLDSNVASGLLGLRYTF